MDPHAPTPAPLAAGHVRPAHERMHAIQVRAFLDASDVVDADPDTIEDILDGFDDTVLSVEDEDEEDGDGDGGAAQDAAGRVRSAPEGADDQDEAFDALLLEGACLDASS